jgi:DNA-binding NtrC family response regulator
MPKSTQPVTHRGLLLRQDRETGGLTQCRYVLEVMGGDEAGTQLVLEGTAVVGSHRDADLRLTDPTVSRYHTELEARSDGIRVRDLGSTNGTLIGGVRVQEGIVEKDTLLLLGNVPVRVRVEVQPVSGDGSAPNVQGLVGRSGAMQQLFTTLAAAAPTDATVLIVGDTGTGKEVIARALHAQSLRAQTPLVTVDCAALSPELVESELFGHVKGAFTGATADRKGAFLAAHGGTLFLDEVGELPLEVQPKLLRAVELGSIRRLGEDMPEHVDVRIVAATRRDLELETKRGTFRSDLYFRLAVITLRLPRLRDRREDIPLLARHFAERLGHAHVELPDALLSRFESYAWPGNVRELANVVERAMAMPGADVELEAAAEHAGGAEAWHGLPFREAKERLIDQFTRAYLSHLLEAHGGNVAEVAQASGIARPYVYELLNRFGLQLPAKPRPPPK